MIITSNLHNLTKRLLLGLLIIGSLFNCIITRAAAISWTGSANGNWTDGTKWSGGVAPGLGDDVTISGTHTVTIDAASIYCNSLFLTGGGSLVTVTLHWGTNKLTVTNSVSIDINTTLKLTGATGTLLCKGLDLPINATLTNTATITIIGDVSGTGNGGCTLTNSSGGTFNLTGNITTNNPIAFANSGTVNIKNCNFTDHGTSDKITNNAGAFFTVDANSIWNYFKGGSITNSGTFNAGTSGSKCTINIGTNGSKVINKANGVFNLNSTSVISFIDSTGNVSSVANVVTNAATSKFNIKSDVNGSGSIGNNKSATAPLTGIFTVERFMSGGAAARRGYRLLSSPVNTSTLSGTIKGYTLQALQKTAPVTGWGVTGLYSATPPTGAFDPSPLGNPSVFFYYEPDAEPPTRAIAKSDYKALSSITDAIPVGNGVLFFFRGDRTASAGKFTTTGTPENTTLVDTGSVNFGDIPVNIPANPLVTYSGSIKQYQQAAAVGTLSTTFSSTAQTPATDGLHLVGNPYPCTIDLEEALKSANFTNPASTTNNYVYALNNSGAFGSYLLTGNGTTGTGAGGITRWIGSGQGFFIRGTSTSTLTFHEACKVTTGYTLPTSFALTTNKVNQAQVLHVNLMLDSANANETVIQFGYRHAGNKFSVTEDAPYLTGPSQTTYLTSYSSDNKPCLINQMSTLDSVKAITLYAAGPVSGTYTLNFDGAASLDTRYKLFLKDALLKDSLDLSSNARYAFNLDRSNAQTYGDKRFSIVVYPSHIQDYYQFTAFDGIKNKSGVLLSWKTTSEGAYTIFKVQRSTDGGKTFSTIGNIESDGSGLYGFTDTSPLLTGVNKYRIVQTVDNTADRLSGLISVNYGIVNLGPARIRVYPNPVAATLQVALKTEDNSGPLTIKIYNIASEVVLGQTFSNGSLLSMDVSKLMQGNYVIHITSRNKDYGSVTFTKI